MEERGLTELLKRAAKRARSCGQSGATDKQCKYLAHLMVSNNADTKEYVWGEPTLSRRDAFVKISFLKNFGKGSNK